jgi:transposase
VLAGNELPSVWVPGPRTRDDREIVRVRLDAAAKVTAVKNQVKALLKRSGLRKPSSLGKGWTRGYRAWLRGLLGSNSTLGPGGRVGLASLLRQLGFLEKEVALLDAEVVKLENRERYAGPAVAMQRLKGVGVLTAMVFLTEMGDLSRFSNRRQVGSYLGLVPSISESGESGDRKGHITHHGNSSIRAVLCQAVWSRVRSDPREEAVYDRIVRRNPHHKKIAVVAVMRRLAIRMWRMGLKAQRRRGVLWDRRTSVA